jgi:hypothetical protein
VAQVTREERVALNDVDLRVVMGTQPGRRLVWRLLEQAGLHTPSFASDDNATAYNEGRRSVAIALMRETQRVCPELWVTMVREQLAATEQEAHKP